jgi:Mg-chelatase subunit ChlI
MDIDPLQMTEDASAPSVANDRLNALVAITVAVLATFMGICKVKDDNIVQAMQAAQVEKVDQWNFYQARNLREELAGSTLELLKASSASPETIHDAVDKYTDLAKRESAKKDEARHAAEEAQVTYDALNKHDDQFDLSDAALSIAIALLAVTALTRKRWLYWIALVPTVFGVLMGLAGLLGWALHPDALANMLG